MPRTVLVAGGALDPHLQTLIRTLTNDTSCRVLTALHGPQTHPSVSWDLVEDKLYLDGDEVCLDAAFFRQDVYNSFEKEDADGKGAAVDRVNAWHTTLEGWVAAHASSVMYFNARGVFTFTNKPYALCVARACGLSIPATLVSNEVGRISSWVGTHGGKDEGLAGGIVKPVCGGSFCSALDEVLPTVEAKNGALAAPAIVQSKLSSPELRIFGVAGHYLAFAVTSPSLDYRVHQDATLSFVECPRALAEGQHRLMEHMGLGYSACDYKTNDKTGQLEFLEVNNGAMFAAFDKASGGVLTRVMALLLAGEPVPPLSHVLVLSL